jgi:hypothetical protein
MVVIEWICLFFLPLKFQDVIEAILVCLKNLFENSTKTGAEMSRNSLNFFSSKVEKAVLFEASTKGNERDLLLLEDEKKRKKVNHLVSLFNLCFVVEKRKKKKDDFSPVCIPESRNQLGMDLV